jgi:phosphoglycolate phosphatase
MLREATILFDLDGTIIDTAPDLIHAANHTLSLKDLPPVGAEIIRPAVSYGARAMIRAAMESHGREASDDELTRMTEQFTAYYSENILVDSRPFPGLIEAIEGLRSEGAVLAVCTNKREVLAKKLLALLNIDNAFRAIAGRDTFAKSKPDPTHVLETIRLAGGDPARAVMIGDSSADSLAAQAAGVPFIGVTFGYGESPIQILKPDAVIETFADLLPAIRGLLGSAAATS